jgi:hypothetical protein
VAIGIVHEPGTAECLSISFGLAPRLFLAGVAAFFAADMLNIFIFTRVKNRTGKKMLWLRSKTGTVTAILAANLIFIPLGYWGSGFPVFNMIYSHAIVQIIIAVIDTFFLYAVFWYARRWFSDEKNKLG